MNWTPQQVAEYCRRRGFAPSVEIAPPVTDADRAAAARLEAKGERELHVLICQELNRREIKFIHAAMNKRSTLPEGWPDFTIFMPGGQVWFAEIKTDAGKTTYEQNRVHRDLDEAGFRVYVPRSFDQFMHAFLREEHIKP